MASQIGMPVFSCSKQVALTNAEAQESIDGIRIGLVGALLVRTGAEAWIRSTSPPFGYVFDEASLALADGVNVVIPRDRTALQPGRWLLFSTGSLASDCPPLSRELFVDGGTTVPVVMQDGAICSPFGTIQAAFDRAATLPDGPVTINATAGTYVEQLTPPNRDGMALRGSGTTQTIVVAPPGPATAAFGWAPGAAAGALIHTFELSDLTLQVDDVAQRALALVGSTVSPDTWLDQGFTLDNVKCVAPAGGQACTFTRVGQLVAVDSELSRGDVAEAFLNCSIVRILRSRLGLPTITWDFADAGGFPGLGRQTFLYDDSTVIDQTTTLTGHPQFLIERTVRQQALGALPQALRGLGLTTHAGTGSAPSIGVHGELAGDLLLPYPDLTGFALAATCDTVGGNFLGSVDISLPAASAVDLNVAGRFARYRGTVIAGRHTNIDIRGSDYDQSLLSAPGVDGSIDRDEHIMLDVDVSAAGDLDIPITPRFPPGVVGYSVGFTQTAAADGIAAGTFSYGAKTPSQFRFHRSGVVGTTPIDMRIHRVA